MILRSTKIISLALALVAVASLLLAPKAAHAQSSLSASVTPYGNAFQCLANGANLQAFTNWGYYVYIYDSNNNLVFSEYVTPGGVTGGNPGTLTLLHINDIVKPNFVMHGYYTCYFNGEGILWGQGPQDSWNASAGVNF